MILIQKYFNNLSIEQVNQFSKLESLYNYWNQKINLISRKDNSQLYLRHVLHSLSIARLIKFKINSDILDVGTGGGFPGLPLAILFPNVNFYLNDSIKKKISVVKDISNSLNLSNINIIHSRAEVIDKKFDFIVSRAVTNMSGFIKLVKNKFHEESKHEIENGILYLKGGDLRKELRNINHKSYPIINYFEEPYFETKQIIYVNYRYL